MKRGISLFSSINYPVLLTPSERSFVSPLASRSFGWFSAAAVESQTETEAVSCHLSPPLHHSHLLLSPFLSFLSTLSFSSLHVFVPEKIASNRKQNNTRGSIGYSVNSAVSNQGEGLLDQMTPSFQFCADALNKSWYFWNEWDIVRRLVKTNRKS